jgi:hypothetical protein
MIRLSDEKRIQRSTKRRRQHPLCKNCHEPFAPDPRQGHGRQQKYCSKRSCRRASKAASQRRWLEKPENQAYFRGTDQVARVRDWRTEHERYWHRARGPPLVPIALQDSIDTQVSESHGKKGPSKPALQDSMAADDQLLQLPLDL